VRYSEGSGFLVDRTAGRLARWLRILGLDVEYLDTGEVSELAGEARRSGRIMLSRNRELCSRLGGGALLLGSEHVEEQVRQVADLVGRRRLKPFSRCNVCNQDLVRVGRDKVRGRVPRFVYETQERFSVCPRCGRLYWHGTHWEHMLERVRNLMEGEAHGEPEDDCRNGHSGS
jgi:hypothetical protein